MIILRLVLVRQALHFVVVDALVFLAHAVRHHVVGLAREVELVAVREVAAVRQVQPHDGVAGRAAPRRRPPGWPAIPSAAAR